MNDDQNGRAEWHGDLAHGSGHMRFGSGAFDGPYDFRSRMGSRGRQGRQPGELLGAAHAGCFSMALALELTKAGATVKASIQQRRSISKTDGVVHPQDRSRYGSVDLRYGGGGLRGTCAGRQEELPSLASLVRRRYSSASQAPASFIALISRPYIFGWRASPMVTTE